MKLSSENFSPQISDRSADQIRYPNKRDEVLDESPDNQGSAFAAENEEDNQLI